MDLSQYEEQDVAEHALETPTGEKLDVIFKFAGPGHPKTIESEQRIARKGLREFNRKGKPSVTDDPEELWEQAAESLAARTLGWSSSLKIDGKDYPFSAQAARDLYLNRRFTWVRVWAQAKLADAAGFIKGSSMDSSRTPSSNSAST